MISCFAMVSSTLIRIVAPSADAVKTSDAVPSALGVPEMVFPFRESPAGSVPDVSSISTAEPFEAIASKVSEKFLPTVRFSLYSCVPEMVTLPSACTATATHWPFLRQ